MKLNKRSIKLTLGMLGCFAVLAVCARMTDNVVPASASVDERPVIVLDAGHGGLDSGAVGANGTLEKDVNLSVVLHLRDMLELSGFRVVLTRDEDISIYDAGVEGIRNQKLSDMDNRLEIVQSYPDSIFLCIHQNNYTDPKYFGGQMFYNNNNANNRTLAQIMQNRFAVLQQGNDREIKLSGDELFLLKSNTNPSLMIECGFLSNPEEEARLATTEYQQQVAFSIYSGLLEYIDATTEDAPDYSITEEA
ncbi:MAG: N-acetylmuramoyl-L-alanine amidase [Oscillospiraceae bacterium]|nr:N-acetylmuramoyl-L-alanine amidase [Oscillospiraceae bacterium]